VVFGKKKFYYNIKTGQVEEGRKSSWTDLMGPYPDRETAEKALDIARARTQEWDATEHRSSHTERETGRDTDVPDVADVPDWGTPGA